jgi:ribonuclease BN (tRNA processing enzyme)
LTDSVSAPSFDARPAAVAAATPVGEPVVVQTTRKGMPRWLIPAVAVVILVLAVGGFFMFMQGMWLQDRRKPLKVYLPGKAIRPLRQMLNTVFLFDEALPFRLQLLPLENENPVKIRDVRVTPFRTTHLDRTRAQFGRKYRADFSAYCFLIEHNRICIGHSADLGHPQDLEPLLAKPLDLLVCELSHFTPDEIFSYLGACQIKQIAFVHIGGAYRQNLPALRRLARKQMLRISCHFPYDGDQLSC